MVLTYILDLPFCYTLAASTVIDTDYLNVAQIEYNTAKNEAEWYFGLKYTTDGTPDNTGYIVSLKVFEKQLRYGTTSDVIWTVGRRRFGDIPP